MLWELTEMYYGDEIPFDEWVEAWEAAWKKLDAIIRRQGDGDGKRYDVNYVAQLAAEEVSASRLMTMTIFRGKRKAHSDL